MKNTSVQLLQQLKLTGMAQIYQAATEMPLNKQPDTHQLIAQMVDAEQQHRSVKRMNKTIDIRRLWIATTN